MSVFHTILANLQEKFSKESDKRSLIASILSDTLHTLITTEQVSYKENVVTVQVLPTIKMALRVKQEELIKLLKEKNISVVAIR